MLEASRAKIAEANARVAEAQLALEKMKSFRSVAAGDQGRFVSSLRGKTSANHADMFVMEGVEPAAFSQHLKALLKLADWRIEAWNWVGAGGASGVIIAYRNDATAEVLKAVDLLVAALNEAHIESTKMPWPDEWEKFGGMLNGPVFDPPKSAPIRIIIATKPL